MHLDLIAISEGRIEGSRYWFVEHRGLRCRRPTIGVSVFMSTVFNE